MRTTCRHCSRWFPCQTLRSNGLAIIPFVAPAVVLRCVMYDLKIIKSETPDTGPNLSPRPLCVGTNTRSWLDSVGLVRLWLAAGLQNQIL